MPVWKPIPGGCRRAPLLLFLSLVLVAAPIARGSSANHPVPVILVSIDTLRADHLGVYGYDRARTPAIDSLSTGGTRFTQVSSQVPLTLPSHVSLFTATYPFYNHVEDNGEILPAGSSTLASALKARGYATAAFIGGFALDRRFGLDQGFDTYDSPFDVDQDSGIDASSLKRPAEEVTRAAETWIDRNTTEPFFLFLHLYDLHTPYQPHERLDVPENTSAYDSELVYTDGVLQQFFDYLRHNGLFEKALIILLSDHGESLGEHGETTHGYFVYQSTLHVPLIMHWPGTQPLPPQVDTPAGLIQVAPTILKYLNVPIPTQFQASGLLSPTPKPGQGSPPAAYAESLYAHNHYECAALRSLRVGRYHYIDAPRPELYDLQSDPGETHNLYTEQRSLGHSLRTQLLSLIRRFPASSNAPLNGISPAAAEQLRALGYMPASKRATAGALEAGSDPKDRIVAYEQTHRLSPWPMPANF